MQITIKYFANIRERLGRSVEERRFDDGSRIGDVRHYVADLLGDAAELVDRSMVMRNQEYAEDTESIHDGDEIAIIPPVSGGDHFHVHDAVLDAASIARRIESVRAGAIVTFVGVVRDNARGKNVSSLEYEAYPAAAEKMMARIGDEIRERWEVEGIAIEHRTGHLHVGEASVVIAISSAHRDAALHASEFAIQRIKEIVPIWKKEFYDDGASWIGSEHDYQIEVGRIET